MFGLGMGELVLIFVIALIFIGPKKLPELAKGLGQGIRDFQKAAKGLTDEFQNSVDASPKPVKPEISEERGAADEIARLDAMHHGDVASKDPNHLDPIPLPTDSDKPKV